MSGSVRIGLFVIDFVPRTSWHRSIARLASGHIWFGHKRIIVSSTYRNIFGRIWRRIRKRELMRARYACEICGSSYRLHVHEIWEYVKERKQQRLKGYKVLCSSCHRVHHSSYLVRRGNTDWLVDYIVSTNRSRGIQVSRIVASENLRKAYRIWIERSNFLWYVDVNSEKYLGNFSDIASLLLNYWVYAHRGNSLINWITTPDPADRSQASFCYKITQLGFLNKLFERSIGHNAKHNYLPDHHPNETE